ncbi:MAG: PepSY-like domain-containing protein [Bacteroidota bacterium]
MKKIFVLFVCSLIVLASSAQKVDKSNVPLEVKKMLFTKANDTLTPVWEKTVDYYKATFTKGELKAEIQIKENAEWIKTIWSLPYTYVPQKIKDNVLTAYPGAKVVSSTIQYRTDGDYYIIEAKKKKEIQLLYYSLKSEFIKIEPKVAVSTNKL